MKTYKQLIAEVAEPDSADERRFKAKHVIKKIGHPIEDDAEELQFKGKTKKDASKKSSYDKGEDKKVYESADLTEMFKMGPVKLADGSSVKLSKEEAEAVNDLFGELNSSNKKRMEEEMTKDQSGFDRIVKFAKESQ